MAECIDKYSESEEEELRNYIRISNSILTNFQLAYTILQYQQYKYINEILLKKHLSDFSLLVWKKYIQIWADVYIINDALMEAWDQIATTPLIRERKNQYSKELNELSSLILDICNEKRHMLTPLPPFPRWDFEQVKPNEDDTYFERKFNILFNFYNMFYGDQPNRSHSELNEMLFKNIFDKREQFDKFVRNFVINQEQSKEILQYWAELKAFVTGHFTKKPHQMLTEIMRDFNKKNKPDEAMRNVMMNQNQNKHDLLYQIDLFDKSVHKANEILQSFLELNIPKPTEYTSFLQLLLNDKFLNSCSPFYQIIFNTFQWDKDDVEQLFLILLLDIRFDVKSYIRGQSATIHKGLINFQNMWRRMLHVPMTLMHFQQYQMHCCNLKLNESKEWLERKKRTVIKLKDIACTLTNFIENKIFAILDILRKSDLQIADQLNEDSRYLNKLLTILKEIYKNHINVSLSLPPIPKLKSVNDANHSTNATQDQLSVFFNLCHFYKLIHVNGNPTKDDFLQWNKDIFEDVFENLEKLNDFINECIGNKTNNMDAQRNAIKIIFNVGKLIGKKTQYRLTTELYGFIFDRNVQWKEQLQSISSIFNSKQIIDDDRMHQMQIYIVLLLNTFVDADNQIENMMNLNANLHINSRIISLELLTYFKYYKLSNIITITEVFYDVSYLIEIISCILETIRKYYKGNSQTIRLGLLNKKVLEVLQHCEQSSVLHRNNKYLEFYTVVLQDIESLHKSILNLKSDEQIYKNQYITNNLYCFWRLFIEKKNFSKKSFSQWIRKTFNLFLLNLNEMDLFLNQFIINNENDNVAKIWNCLKKFLKSIVLNSNRLNDNDAEEMEYNALFTSLVDDNNSYLPEGMEYFFNSMNTEYSNIFTIPKINGKFEMLSILILLDAPNTIKQIGNFICWQSTSHLTNVMNCNQFHCFQILNKSNINDIINFYKFSAYGQQNKTFQEFVYASEKLNDKSLNIANCLKEIFTNKIAEDLFFLDAIQQFSTNSFELEMSNDFYLIKSRQILYLQFYFANIIVDKLEEKGFDEKMQYMINYIYKNIKEMEEFINCYFGRLENTSTFRSNWNLVKIKINTLTEEQFTHSWKLLFLNNDKCEIEEYFNRRHLYTSKLTVELNEKKAAKHVLLILLNVPICDIFKTQYKQFLDLDELFSLMCRYKELKLNRSPYEKQFISTQSNLAMDKFLTKLEKVSNASEGENESSALLVKSQFNELPKKTKAAVIENLIDVVYTQNTFGYCMVFQKILLSFLPLLDIILDIFLARKFFLLNEMQYFYLTIAILVIAGFATIVTTEKMLKSEIEWKPTYCVKILKYDKLNLLFSFTQLIIFLRALNEALLRFRIKNNKTNSYLEYINYGDPNLLKKDIQTIKYVEMCFEAIPQTILQLYIILITNHSSLLQLLSILSSICSAMATVWAYISSRNPREEPSFMKNRTLLFRELCFYGLRIISTSLILLIFSWPIIIIWMVVRFSLDFLIGVCIHYFIQIVYKYFHLSNGILMQDYKINSFSWFNSIHSDLLDYKIYNIFVLVEFIVAWFILVFHLDNYSNNFYYGPLIFSIYPTFLIIWTIIIYQDNFSYSVIVTPQNSNFNDKFVRIKENITNAFPSVCSKNKQISEEELKEEK